MRKVILVCATVAVVLLGIASAVLNFRFGYEQGRHTAFIPGFANDGTVFGSISVALDLFKTTLPFFMVWACVSNRSGVRMRLSVFLIAFLFWVPVSIYSFNSAVGAALLGRTTSVGARSGEIDNSVALKTERAAPQSKKPIWTATLEPYRALPSQAIDEQIESFKQNILWKRTKECADATAPESLTFCQQLFAMKSAKAIAAAQEQDTRRISEIDAQLRSASGIVSSDPQADAYAALSGVSKDKVAWSWAILLALLLESIANVGPSMILMAGRLIVEQTEADKPAKPSKALTINKNNSGSSGPVPPKGGQTNPTQPDKTRQDAHYKLNVVPFLSELPQLPKGKKPSLVDEVMANALRGLQPGEHPLPDIMDAVRKEAKAVGMRSAPHKKVVGEKLRVLGMSKRRGPEPQKATLYNLVGKGVGELQKASVSA